MPNVIGRSCVPESPLCSLGIIEKSKPSSVLLTQFSFPSLSLLLTRPDSGSTLRNRFIGSFTLTFASPRCCFSSGIPICSITSGHGTATRPGSPNPPKSQVIGAGCGPEMKKLGTRSPGKGLSAAVVGGHIRKGGSATTHGTEPAHSSHPALGSSDLLMAGGRKKAWIDQPTAWFMDDSVHFLT